MKAFVCLVCAVGLVVSLSAQVSTLCISSNKTTSLVFPFPIKHVDRGSKDILVQQVPEAENILFVKAASPGIAETNLSVVTGDGGLYSFSICYDKQPSVWVYQLPVNKKATLASSTTSLLDNPPALKGPRDRHWDVEAKLTGIYVKEDHFFFQFDFINDSPLDYTLDYLRFFIRDKKQSKRTAIQEIEYRPLFTAGNASLVKANDNNVVVVALEKFTIPDHKRFLVQIGEKGGGRQLQLTLSNRMILKARRLPDIK